MFSASQSVKQIKRKEESKFMSSRFSMQKATPKVEKPEERMFQTIQNQKHLLSEVKLGKKDAKKMLNLIDLTFDRILSKEGRVNSLRHSSNRKIN